MFVLVALIIGALVTTELSAQPAPAATPPPRENISAADAFAHLARMVGTWRPENKPESPLRIRFYLTARDTVLVESWESRGQPHSLTLYHRDGEALLATHYCPQGNQPRRALAGGDVTGIRFVFRDATDLQPATESHQHELWFDLGDPERPVRGETYWSKDGPGTPERLHLVRDGGT